MKLFIPPIGSKLILSKPWTFGLYSERRNDTLIQKLRDTGHNIPERAVDPNNPWASHYTSQLLCDFTLLAGTQLSVSRIYIRQGNKEYDSVSFNISTKVNGKSVKGRFWAKLDDVNQMEIKETSA